METENKKSIINWLVLLACVVLVVVFMMSSFSQKVAQKTQDDVLEDLADLAGDNAMKFQNELMEVTVSGQVAVRLLAEADEPSAEEIRQILSALVDCTQLYQAIYYTADKTVAADEAHMQNVSQIEVPESAKKGDINVYLYLPEGDLAEQETVLIMLPVAKKGSRLLLYYPMDRFRSLLADTRNATYGKQVFSVLTDNSGQLLYRGDESSPFLSGAALWEHVDTAYQKQVDKVIARMKSMGKGNAFLSAGGEERVLVYATVPACGWLVVEGMKQDYISQQVNAEWLETGKMLYMMIGVAVIVVLIILVTNLVMRGKNLKENKGLQEKADTDQLTGLNNKLATERKIKEYIKENPDALCMMFVLDIDNFKNINDTMGHAFGDEVLRELGVYICTNFRVTDIIGRTGGDEFTIFLKALKDESNVMKEAQKLLTFFRGFQVGEYTKYSVTASIGAAVYPAHGSEFEALYKAADQALYKAKKRGKNQLAFYDDRDRKEDSVQNDQ